MFIHRFLAPFALYYCYVLFRFVDRVDGSATASFVIVPTTTRAKTLQQELKHCSLAHTWHFREVLNFLRLTTTVKIAASYCSSNDTIGARSSSSKSSFYQQHEQKLEVALEKSLASSSHYHIDDDSDKTIEESLEGILERAVLLYSKIPSKVEVEQERTQLCDEAEQIVNDIVQHQKECKMSRIRKDDNNNNNVKNLEIVTKVLNEAVSRQESSETLLALSKEYQHLYQSQKQQNQYHQPQQLIDCVQMDNNEGNLEGIAKNLNEAVLRQESMATLLTLAEKYQHLRHKQQQQQQQQQPSKQLNERSSRNHSTAQGDDIIISSLQNRLDTLQKKILKAQVKEESGGKKRQEAHHLKRNIHKDDNIDEKLQECLVPDGKELDSTASHNENRTTLLDEMPVPVYNNDNVVSKSGDDAIAKYSTNKSLSTSYGPLSQTTEDSAEKMKVVTKLLATTSSLQNRLDTLQKKILKAQGKEGSDGEKWQEAHHLKRNIHKDDDSIDEKLQEYLLQDGKGLDSTASHNENRATLLDEVPVPVYDNDNIVSKSGNDLIAKYPASKSLSTSSVTLSRATEDNPEKVRVVTKLLASTSSLQNRLDTFQKRILNAQGKEGSGGKKRQEAHHLKRNINKDDGIDEKLQEYLVLDGKGLDSTASHNENRTTLLDEVPVPVYNNDTDISKSGDDAIAKYSTNNSLSTPSVTLSRTTADNAEKVNVATKLLASTVTNGRKIMASMPTAQVNSKEKKNGESDSRTSRDCPRRLCNKDCKKHENCLDNDYDSHRQQLQLKQKQHRAREENKEKMNHKKDCSTVSTRSAGNNDLRGHSSRTVKGKKGSKSNFFFVCDYEVAATKKRTGHWKKGRLSDTSTRKVSVAPAKRSTMLCSTPSGATSPQKQNMFFAESINSKKNLRVYNSSLILGQKKKKKKKKKKERRDKEKFDPGSISSRMVLVKNNDKGMMDNNSHGKDVAAKKRDGYWRKGRLSDTSTQTLSVAPAQTSTMLCSTTSDAISPQKQDMFFAESINSKKSLQVYNSSMILGQKKEKRGKKKLREKEKFDPEDIGSRMVIVKNNDKGMMDNTSRGEDAAAKKRYGHWRKRRLFDTSSRTLSVAPAKRSTMLCSITSGATSPQKQDMFFAESINSKKSLQVNNSSMILEQKKKKKRGKKKRGDKEKFDPGNISSSMILVENNDKGMMDNNSHGKDIHYWLALFWQLILDALKTLLVIKNNVAEKGNILFWYLRKEANQKQQVQQHNCPGGEQNSQKNNVDEMIIGHQVQAPLPQPPTVPPPLQFFMDERRGRQNQEAFGVKRGEKDNDDKSSCNNYLSRQMFFVEQNEEKGGRLKRGNNSNQVSKTKQLTISTPFSANNNKVSTRKGNGNNQRNTNRRRHKPEAFDGVENVEKDDDGNRSSNNSSKSQPMFFVEQHEERSGSLKKSNNNNQVTKIKQLDISTLFTAKNNTVSTPRGNGNKQSNNYKSGNRNGLFLCSPSVPHSTVAAAATAEAATATARETSALTSASILISSRKETSPTLIMKMREAKAESLALLGGATKVHGNVAKFNIVKDQNKDKGTGRERIL